MPAAVRPSSGPKRVQRYWAGQLALMRSLPATVAAREPDDVHDLRAAGRRLRTTIRAFGPLERRGASARVIAELAWYNDVLGAARDAEVTADRVAELIGDPESIDGSGLIGTLEARRELTAERADEMLASRRTAALLDALDDFIDDPWRGSVDRGGKGPSGRRIRERVDWSQRRVERAWRALPPESVGEQSVGAQPGGGSARASAEHRLRRRAKAARYVLESVDSAVPQASAAAGRYADLAALLGTLQDVVVIDRVLAAARPPLAGGEERIRVARQMQVRRAEEARSGLDAAVRAALGSRAGR